MTENKKQLKFSLMPVGSSIHIPVPSGGDMLAIVARVKKSIAYAKQTNDVDVRLDQSPQGGFNAVIIANPNYKEIKRKDLEHRAQTSERNKAKVGRKPNASHKPKPGQSTVGVRRAFWRMAFLRALDPSTTFDIKMAIDIANGSLAAYDGVSASINANGDDHHEEEHNVEE